MDAIRAYRADLSANLPMEDPLVAQHLPFVLNIARRYARSDLDLPDLVQAGNLGMLQASEHFDRQRGVAFSTYASIWIKKEILYLLNERFRAQGIPDDLITILHRVRRAHRALLQATGAEPSQEEVANYLQIPPERVQTALQLDQEPISLDRTLLEDGEMTLADLLEAEESTQPEYHILSLSVEVSMLLQKLNEQEREVITQRFGITGQEQSYRAIAKKLHIGIQRVQRIEQRALIKLRRFAIFEEQLSAL